MQFYNVKRKYNNIRVKTFFNLLSNKYLKPEETEEYFFFKSSKKITHT